MFAALVIALALRVGAVALELHPQRPPLQLANLPCKHAPLQHPQTWPIIGCISVALGWTTYMMTRAYCA